jgi:hypothetical protein
MALLWGLFGLDYREVGVLAKDFVLSEEFSNDEEQLISLLGVERARFLRERRALRAGLAYCIFGIFEDKSSNKDIGLAKYIFERTLREHPSAGTGFPSQAFMTYYSAEPMKLSELFLKELADRNLSEPDAHKVVLLAPFMERYFRDVGLFIQSKLAKLR